MTVTSFARIVSTFALFAILVLACTLPLCAQEHLKVYYLRHAEGGHNVVEQWKNMPTNQWPSYVGNASIFTPKGQKQVAVLTKRLKGMHFDFIAVSPTWRTRNTILPYLKDSERTGEIWPELVETPVVPVEWTNVFDKERPGPRADLFSGKTPVFLPVEERPYFNLREDGANIFRIGDENKDRETANSLALAQRTVALIKKRFGKSGKSILLVGHENSGSTLLRVLTNAKDSPVGLNNTGIWMAEEQSDGTFKLKWSTDRRDTSCCQGQFSKDVTQGVMKAMITSISEKGKVGVMCCGHREYWPQFPGMREEVVKYMGEIANYVKDSDAQLLDSRFVDSIDDSLAYGRELTSKGCDLLVLYIPAYVASGRWMQGVLAAHCPVVLVGMQNTYKMGGKITIQKVTTDGGPCALPEAYSAMVRSGKEPAGLIFGRAGGDPHVVNEIHEWCKVANALHAFKGSRFGYIGHPYEGMMDMNFDPTAVTKTFGAYVCFPEMCEVVKYIENCSKVDLDSKMAEIKHTFEIVDASYDTTTKNVDASDL